jgi:PAS domain S-box-containing protein
MPPFGPSSEALAVFFDAQPAPVLVVDEASSGVVFANSAALELLGFGRDELSGRRLDELVPEPLRAHHRKPREASNEGTTPLTQSECVFRTKAGRELSVSLSVTAVRFGDAAYRVASLSELSPHGEMEPSRLERPSPLVESSDDITGQRRAEQALALAQKSLSESEQKFEKAFAASPHPICITDVETGVLLEINDAFERVFGFQRTESLGKSTVALGIWDDPSERGRIIARLSEQPSFRDWETTGRDRHGRELRLVLNGEVIDLAGRPTLVTYVKDVTEREAAKRALVESEALFAKAFRASPDALVVFEVESERIIEVNDGFERLFGRARADVVGRTALELELWQDELERRRANEILDEERTLRDFPIIARAASGALKECLLSAEQLELSTGPSVIAIVRDVTEKVRAERARTELEAQLRQAQKMEALGTLAGGIAHDFNNILGAIMAYCELIKLDIQLPRQIESYLAELRRAGERAKDLVQQILTFSRRQPQQRRALRLEHAVREALNLLRSTLPATIELDVRLAADAPVVLADPTLIHQVLMNLGTNAAHAMGGGVGRLTVELDDAVLAAGNTGPRSELLPGRYARLRVRDNGAGMDAETLKHVFEPFFTTKGPGEGTGLGLAVVHGIVRDHEGAIFFESEPGRGTSVTVYLPEHAVELDGSSDPSAELLRANGETVLFIDDEAVLCRSVSGLLERLGYRVTARTDPAEALALFRKKPDAFDVVLTDLTMPALTGVDVAREVLRVTPHKPVLLMSGYSSSWTAESVRTLGVVDLIAKPLGAARLSQSLAAALGTHDSVSPKPR